MNPMTSKAEKEISLAIRASQAGAGELLKDQEFKVLNRLIAAYRSKEGLSPEAAKVGIGVITELRNLRATMSRAVEQGQIAATKLTE